MSKQIKHAIPQLTFLLHIKAFHLLLIFFLVEWLLLELFCTILIYLSICVRLLFFFFVRFIRFTVRRRDHIPYLLKIVPNSLFYYQKLIEYAKFVVLERIIDSDDWLTFLS